jgi:hypothetical protein
MRSPADETFGRSRFCERSTQIVRNPRSLGVMQPGA